MLFCSIDQLNSCRPMESICSSCNRSFLTSLSCGNCNRSFNSEHALEQHLRDSLVHHLVPETPLDGFFRSFSTFEYDPSQLPATSYARLRAHEGWQRGEAASADAWNRYQGALEGELRMWYGDEDDLAAWHALCHAIGVEPLPRTCDRCEQAVRKTHVNIVDLVQ
ncbi:hypothetical protein HBI47_093480 [Parastagonospora nodorum]|nr:hypothetical protein HBI47_093480 [Parastagonospora nodorum]